jgi:hypothetical protein
MLKLSQKTNTAIIVNNSQGESLRTFNRSGMSLAVSVKIGPISVTFD